MDRIGIGGALIGAFLVMVLGVVANIGQVSPYMQKAEVIETTSSGGTGDVPPDNVTDDPVTEAVPPADDPEPDPVPPAEEPVDTQVNYAHCPFPPMEDRVIIDFTYGGVLPISELVLRADKSFTEASRVWHETPINPGVYTVQVASYDDHRFDTGTNMEQQWYLQLSDANGESLLTTHPTRDIPDSETMAIEIVERDAEVEGVVTKAMARHQAYPDSEPQAFVPLCAALDRTGDIDTVETTTSDQTMTDETDQSTVSNLTYRRCPIPEREGRILVDLTNGGTIPVEELSISANGDKTDALHVPVPKYIPQGTYKVRLASYNGHVEALPQDHEEWFGQLLDVSGSLIGKTAPSRDIPDWEDEFVSIVDEHFELKSTAVRFGVMHSRHPSNEPNTVAALCASFDTLNTNVERMEDEVSVIETDTTVYMGGPEIDSDGTKADAVSTSETPAVEDGLKSDHLETTVLPVIAVDGPQDDTMTTREVSIVTEEMLQNRNEVVAEIKDAPFEFFQRAGEYDREQLARKLLLLDGAQENDTPGSDEHSKEETSTPSPFLGRLSNEESKSEEQTIGADEVVDKQKLYVRKYGAPSATSDRDGDGISDFDEEFIYHTNPDNAFTGGSALSDGERLLLGLDPQTDDTNVVVVESPKISGDVDETLFRIDTLELLQDTQDNTMSGHESPAIKGVAEVDRAMKIGGYAQPLSFVTLYIYSTPIIVTVRADESGRFEYVLDKTIENGSHELYVATVNNSGKILAKSDPIPFVKTAEAVERTPNNTVPIDPVNESVQRMLTMMLLLVLIVTVLTIVWLGMMRRRDTSEELTADTHEN